jgi:hypothetical protein
MICETTRQTLLNSEHPDRPPPALRAHLIECPSCRAWLRNLVEIETRVPYLPVPSSEAAKAQLLDELRDSPLVPPYLRVVAPELPLTPPKERGLRKASVAVALAAAVVMFAIGLSLWPRNSGTRDNSTPVASKPFDQAKWWKELREERLAKAQNPLDRVSVLADFADGLLQKARDPNLLPAVDQLELLAGVYEETVRTALVEHARTVPAQQKTKLPRLASELGRTESEFSRMAAGSPQDIATQLRRIAAAAHDADVQLREIARQA